MTRAMACSPAAAGGDARATKASGRRRVLMGLAHQGAALLGWDDAFRRQEQARLTGCASCRDMTDAQLAAWCWRLKRLGAPIGIPGPAPRGGSGLDCPSDAQLAAIERLAAEFGWSDGLEDRRLLGFVRKTAKVDAVRFLTRRQATDVISGLRRWMRGWKT